MAKIGLGGGEEETDAGRSVLRVGEREVEWYLYAWIIGQKEGSDRGRGCG